MMKTMTPFRANFTPIKSFKLSVNALQHFTTRVPPDFDISAGEDQTWFQCPETSLGQDGSLRCGQDLEAVFLPRSASMLIPQVA